MKEYDVIIAGAGHNGLMCGAVLARAGLKVLAVERNPWIGGSTATLELTMPGFKNDFGGSSHVWIQANPLFRELKPELEKYGLKYIYTTDQIHGHPFPDGTGITLYTDVERTTANIARFSERDAQRYREIYDGWLDIRDGYITQFFSPPLPPSILPSVMENSPEGLDMLRNYNLSPMDFVLENFEERHVRTFMLMWAVAPDIPPDRDGIGKLFYIMIPAVHSYGQAVPEGGSDMLARTLAKYIEAHGGKVLLDSPVARFIVEDGEAKGVELASGERASARLAVVSSIDPKHTFLEMIEEGVLDEKFLHKARNFRPGRVTGVRSFYALEESPKFRAGEEVSRAPFWRICGWWEDLIKVHADIAVGELPQDPLVLSHCPSLVDPTRAPDGKHTITLDTWVPYELADGSNWDEIKEDVADLALEKFRQYTTNMTDSNILARHVHSPLDRERHNPCLLKGHPNIGDMTLAQMGYFRPFAGWSQYRTPIKKLYMTGASCHPGGGINGMGAITGNVILEDLELKKPM